MFNEIAIFGISAKEINEKYPALGGYEVLCYLIMEGSLRPFRLTKSIGKGEYKVEPLLYQRYGVSRHRVLGNPIGAQRIDAWDDYPYDECFVFDPDKVLFETEAVEKILELYPDILDSEEVLFSFDKESGEIIHAREKPSVTLPNAHGEHPTDLTDLFREKSGLREDLKGARARIAFLEKENASLRQSGGFHSQTQPARDAQAKNTAKKWAKDLETAVILGARVAAKWTQKRGDEPWAQGGFTHNELREMADELGGLSQRGLAAFKTGFNRAHPNILKKGSGCRRT